MTKMLKRELEGKLSKSEILNLCSGFDIVGDIAITRIPNSLVSKKRIIGETILQNLKSIKTVLRQTSPISGDYRIRYLEYISGENKTTTVYREYNCLFNVDLSKVYFSPRLSSERYRIAKKVVPNEVIINMFAGIGLFSIIIAKNQPNSFTHSIDINPHAYFYMQENIKLNKVINKVKPILGDAGKIIEDSLMEIADRVIMPLPEKSIEYLKFALKALKSRGGIIHYYTHLHASKNEDPIEKAINEIASYIDLPYSILETRKVRDVGPRWSQIAIDVQVQK
jgi:tRNA (guanine37-N1)-methyltransferase